MNSGFSRGTMLATSAIVCMVVASPAMAQERSFDIPAQSATTAVAALARQANVQVFAARKYTRGKRANAVRGTMGVEQALDQLLKGTGLTIRATGAQTYTVVPLALGGPASYAPTQVAAQAVEQEEANVDIVVTATRRSESIRDVPSSLAVVSGRALEDQAATGLDDYLRQVPGVQFNDLGAGQASTITIRGVSTSAQSGITQQTVGIYVDEIPFSDVFSFLSTPDLTPFDLDRVEVLRGPQGALYGSGSMGGAIRYVTAKPRVGHFEGKVNGALSATEGGGINTLSQAMLNVPVGDSFAMRGVVSYTTNAGYVDSPVLGLKNTDSLEQLHARIAARWQPNERTDIQASYIYQKARNDDYSTISDPTGKKLVDNGGTWGVQLTYRLANLTANYDLGFADFLGSASYAGKRRSTDVNLHQTPTETQVRLAPYEGFLTAFFTPAGAYTPGNLQARGIEVITTSFAKSDGYFAEGRLTSKTDGRFRWLAGFLYSDIKNFNPIFQDAPGFYSALSSYVLPGGANAAQFLGVTSDRIFDFFQRSHAREKAGYFDLEFDITDQFEITAGGRYYDFDVSTQIALGGAIIGDLDNKESAFQPRVTASYKASPDTLFYAVYSKGYRVGGVNDTIAFTLLPGQNIEDSPAPLEYNTDSLSNYEFGVKSQLFGGKLQFDLAAYYIDWSDIQLSAFFPAPLAPGGGISAITNVGSAKIYGAETQFTFRPTHWAELVSSISYNDAELAEPSPLVQNVVTGAFISAPAGTQLPGSRKWQVANTLVLRGNAGKVPLTFTASHQYASGTLLDIVYQERLPSYHLVNLNLDARLRDNVRVGLFARNLLDERAVVQINPFPPRGYTVTRPRTVGVSLSADF